MKRFYPTLPITLLLLAFLLPVPRSTAQSAEAQQLLLNVEKLTQLKTILSDMKKGYEVLSQGYGAVRDISQGNFSLHKIFLDRLLEVNPEVKNYHKVGEILRFQRQLLEESKSSVTRFRQTGLFTSREIGYLDQVFRTLLAGSTKDLEELTIVLTSSSLRMGDAERLLVIDRLHAGVLDRLQFLRHFQTTAQLLARQRGREQADTDALRKLHRLPH